MISVGIDISKGKSTVCIMKPYGEVISMPFDVNHVENELSKLVDMIKKLHGEVKIIMEATGKYHLPILGYFLEHKFFISVINPLIMKKYASTALRKGKTDKLDAIKIAYYGIDNWFRLEEYQIKEETYEELRLLGRQYAHYIKLLVDSKLSLTTLLDQAMPGIKNLLKNHSNSNGNNKLRDFIAQYWHFDNITKKSQKQFINSYISWAKKKGYHPSEAKAIKIYALAKEGIPTIKSNSPSTKMLLSESVRVLKEIEKTLLIILSRMQEISKTLKEYNIVREMHGVGDVLAPRLIAEIGDARRFYSGKALVAYAGIDAPPYESGQFVGTKRKISKRGSSTLRKTGYEIMTVLKSHKPKGDAVYNFIIKKEQEGKPKKVAKIAGLNKFLRIYYARVKEVYQ
jgi:transposase